MARVFGRSSPSSRYTDSRRTTACTIAESPKPRISAQRISQAIEPAMPSAAHTCVIVPPSIPQMGI